MVKKKKIIEMHRYLCTYICMSIDRGIIRPNISLMSVVVGNILSCGGAAGRAGRGGRLGQGREGLGQTGVGRVNSCVRLSRARVNLYAKPFVCFKQDKKIVWPFLSFNSRNCI